MNKSKENKLNKLVDIVKSKKVCKVSHTFKLNKELTDKIDSFSKTNEITKTDLVEIILNDYFGI